MIEEAVVHGGIRRVLPVNDRGPVVPAISRQGCQLGRRKTWKRKQRSRLDGRQIDETRLGDRNGACDLMLACVPQPESCL